MLTHLISARDRLSDYRGYLRAGTIATKSLSYNQLPAPVAKGGSPSEAKLFRRETPAATGNQAL